MLEFDDPPLNLINFILKTQLLSSPECLLLSLAACSSSIQHEHTRLVDVLEPVLLLRVHQVYLGGRIALDQHASSHFSLHYIYNYNLQWR